MPQSPLCFYASLQASQVLRWLRPNVCSALQKSMSGISVHPDAVNIVWELRVKKQVRARALAPSTRPLAPRAL